MDAHIIAPVAVFIYGLIDPRNGHLRYVGRTKQGFALRLSAHIRRAREASDRHVHSWIRGVLLAGMKPEIIPLEQSDADGWVEAEQFWIEYARSLGADLTNIAAGGLGALGFHHTMEQRQKWRRERRGENHCWFGKIRSPEVHEALKAGKLKFQQEHGHPMLGKRHSAETRAKMSSARTGLPLKLTDDGARRKSEAAKRMWADPEYREWRKRVMSGANNPNYGKTVSHSEETKAKIGAAHRGMKRSDETRRKISEAAKRRPKKVREGHAP
jgi:hypothetical protein